MTSFDRESIRERVWQAAVAKGKAIKGLMDRAADKPTSYRQGDYGRADMALYQLCIEVAESEQRSNARPEND